MGGQNNMVDEKVLQQLVKDIGLDNARKFMDSLGERVPEKNKQYQGGY